MMPFGSVRDQPPISLNDTAELRSYLIEDEVPVEAADIASATFTVKRPDGTQVVQTGIIEPDGAAFLRYVDTDQVGTYIWVCRFELTSGQVRSKRDDFRVQDPFSEAPSPRRTEIAQAVWIKLEDCFDSDLGGPWLRDWTLAWFEPEKIEKFVDQGLMMVNVWPPTTNLDLGYFTTKIPDSDPSLPEGTMQTDPDQYIIVQATLVAVIKHLMRSYVEQPNPQGPSIVWSDRRDYLQRWSTILEIEERALKETLSLWKRQFYNFGRGALLTHTKAGRVYPNVMGWRTRNAGRGYY